MHEAQPEPYQAPGVGRATEGRDFVPLRGSVVFLANQSEANITLQVLDDEDPERDESVLVKLISVELISGQQERLSKILIPPLQLFFFFFFGKMNLGEEILNHCLASFSSQFPFFGLQG